MDLHVNRQSGTGTPVLLLHGTGSSAAMWRPCQPLFAGRTTVAPDLPGAGRSPRVGGPWTMEDDLAALRSLLDEHERWQVVAHSYGATLGLHLAARDDRIARLIVHEPVVWSVVHAFGSAADQRELDEALADILAAHNRGEPDEAFLQLFVDFWNGAGAWQALSPRSRQRLTRVGRKARNEVVDLLTQRTDGRVWSTLAQPVLVTCGVDSPAPERRAMKLLTDNAPAMALTMVPGGHLAPLHHTEAWMAAVRHALF